MERIGKIILMSLLLITAACEKVVTVTQKETVTVTDTVTVTETIIQKDTVQSASPVPSLPAWSTSAVRIGLIGDSISTFEGWLPEGYSAYYPKTASEITEVTHTYWYRLIYELMPDATLDRNLAYSGSRVSKIGAADSDKYDFVSRIDNVGFDNPDIVLIHGGTNDRRVSTPEHVPLGEYGFDLPLDQLDRYCFRSSYVCMVRKIMDKHPGVKIVCIIGDTLNTEKYQGLADSIRTIAEHYGFSIVNFSYALESADGVHPNASGAQYMADRIYEVMAQDGLLYYKK